MPMTINGVGTHYYGKKHASVRMGTCAACYRVGALESYDTRLWVVVLFVPLIPLGRKRIIDECPACRRHFVASASAYAQARQLQTSAALERYQRAPSPETALAAHGQLLAFREHAQAAEFRAAALPRFPRHAGLRSGLAQQLQQVASFAEAGQLYQEAYDLDPNDPGARTNQAFQLMDRGDLDGARGLLGFLEEPGAGRHYLLGPLDVLAGGYQRVGRHDEVLQLAAVLLREWPHLGNHYPFRAFVRKSEKALRRRESILPRRPFSLLGLFRAKDSPYAPWQRRVAIGSTVAVLVAAGLALNNEYIRRHRTLHVINACGAPVQVQVDDEPAVAVSGLGQLTVSEGPHTVRLSGPVEETHEIELGSGYFARWFRNPAWVLNPGGEAVLHEVEHVYAVRPRPGRQRLIVGQPFFAAPYYDYLFTPAPHSMSVSNKTTEVVKTELAWVRDQDVEAFYSTLATDRAAALRFAERRLRRRPAPVALLRAYLSAVNAEDLPRVRALLRSGLDVRPVNIPWHRAYQNLAEPDTSEADVLAWYDRALAAEPTNAALLYLRGRDEPDEKAQAAYYRRAIAADDRLAWPWVGLAAQAEAWGRWAEALEAVARAKERPIEETDLLDDLTHVARLALGQAAALVPEYRARLDANPFEAMTLVNLADALAAAGMGDEVEATFTAWENRLPPEARGQVVPQLRAQMLYQAGQAGRCVALGAETPVLRQSPIHAQALLALGKARQAADDPELAKVWDDPWNALALSVAFSLDGQSQDAARWHARAREKMRQRRVADLLGATASPTSDDLGHVHLTTANKALLLAALAARFPARQGEYLALAAKLNVRRTAPYLLVQRAVDHKFAGQP